MTDHDEQGVGAASAAPSPRCDCPLCNPSKWGPGLWRLAESPLPKGVPIAQLHLVHWDGTQSWYVLRAPAPRVDLDEALRLAAEFWTEPGDQQAARTALVALVTRVRALTAAGDAVAEAWEERTAAIGRLDLQAGQDAAVRFDEALAAWRDLAGGAS